MNVPSTIEYGIRNVAADTGLQRFSFILTRVCLKTQNAGHFDKSQIAAM